MLRHSPFVLFFATIGSGLSAQSFQVDLGGARHQEAVAVLTDPGGTTSVVRDASVADGPVRIRLLHTTLGGAAPQWHDVDLPGSCFAQGAVDAGDGAVMVCGSCIRPGRNDHDALLVKVSATGAVLSSWLTDTPDEEEQLLGLERTTDGGYIAAGAWRGTADRDALVVRFNDAGQSQWMHHYGTASDELARAVTVHGSGYTAVGLALTFAGDADGYILHVDAAGNEQWWQGVGGAQDDDLFDVMAVGDDVVMAGYTDTYGATTHTGVHFRNVSAMKMDPQGNLVWSAALGDTLTHNGAQTIALAQNGDLLFGGVRGKSDLTQALVMRATPTGGLLWMRTYEMQRASEVQDIRPLPDNGLLAAGRCFGPESGQVLLLRKDPQGQ